jgi:hypothetical protein
MKNGQYLCALGNTLDDKITSYDVGTFSEDRQTFSFRNGSYNSTELNFNKKIGSSIACVVKAKLISDIEF